MTTPNEQPELAFGVREGDLLAGKYRMENVLGVGGMGVVVAARHVDLDERVAIKFLLPQTLGNLEAVGRFAREARAAVKIKSEHVAKVTDVGKLESGAPYMVMEYLEGSDLAAWLRRMGVLPVEQAVEFVLQACEAIAEAHALRIVHRDLKPANLFVIRRPDGALSVKVLDFGISKTTTLTGSSAAGSVTKTSALMGSPLYMSPEQMQTPKDVDARGDIWALGVILYELLTAALPFVADTMPELILRVVQAPAEPLRVHRPDAPEGLEAVILRCLEKDRDRRFQTVADLAVALLPFAPKRARISVERISGVMRAAGYSASAVASPPSSDQQSNVTGSGTNASWCATLTKQRAGSVRIVTGLGVAALLGAGIAGWNYHRANADLEKRADRKPVPATSGPKTTQDERKPPDTTQPASTGSAPDEAPGNDKPPEQRHQPACAVGASQCAGNSLRTCVAGGHWRSVLCTPGSHCREGVCELMKPELVHTGDPVTPTATTQVPSQLVRPPVSQPTNVMNYRK